MEIKETLREQLVDDELENYWRQSMEGMVEEDQQEELLEWVHEIRDEILDYADVVDDREEVKRALVIYYIRIKTNWMLVNDTMNYQAVETGQPDQELMMKGALASKLIERMENVLGGDDVSRLTEFLSEPKVRLEAITVDDETLDTFQEFIQELVVTGEMYRNIREHLTDENVSDDCIQKLEETNKAFQDLSSDIQAELLELQKRPLKHKLEKFPVLVRERTVDTDLQVDVDLEGKRLQIEQEYLEPLDEILTELVENALVHGYHPENGPNEGTITITAEQLEDSVKFTVSDDGLGFDRDRLEELSDGTVRVKGVRSRTENEERLQAVFQPGLTTLTDPEPDRGFGLSTVLEKVNELRGSVSVWNNDEGGALFELTLPRHQSLVVVEGFQVRTGDQRFLLPLDSVLETKSCNQVTITDLGRAQRSARVRDELFPLYNLGSLIDESNNDIPSVMQNGQNGVVMLLEALGEDYAVYVDEILGQKRAVLRESGPIMKELKYAKGTAVMGTNEVNVVLDPEGLSEVLNDGSRKEEVPA